MAKLLLPAVTGTAAVVAELSWSSVGEEGGGAGLYWEEMGGAKLGFGRVNLHFACNKINKREIKKPKRGFFVCSPDV